MNRIDVVFGAYKIFPPYQMKIPEDVQINMIFYVKAIQIVIFEKGKLYFLTIK